MIRIGTLNARGLRDKRKRNQIFSFLKSKRLDLVLIQETHGTQEIEPAWCTEWGGEIYFSHFNSASRGVMILCSSAIKVRSSCSDTSGRWVRIEVIIQDMVFTLFNLYAPNNEREQIEYYDNVNNYIMRSTNADNIIIGGDFNVHLENIDKKGANIGIKKSKQNIQQIMNNYNLIDIWREKHKSTKQYTWENATIGVMTRLDYYLISRTLQSEVDTCVITESILTDHRMVILSLKTNSKSTRGPGFWKFNNSLLIDNTYNEQATKIMAETWDETSDMTDIRVRWDYLKFQIQTHAVTYSKRKAKVRREIEQKVTEQLDNLHKAKCSNGLSDQQDTKRRELQATLENIYAYKERGAQIRSRVEFIEKNEKSNKYFYNQEKQQFARKTITKLQVNDDIVTQERLILHELSVFYNNLFASKYKSIPTFEDIERINIPTLSEDNKRMCDKELSSLECKIALQSMNKNKSPGCDGLTVEFYIRFWEALGGKLTETLAFVQKKGELSTSQKRGVITLLAKKGKDELFIKNWRPVSLLNIDYKILTKALAKRLSNVIPSLIHVDQKGFIKGRYIGENIRQAQDIIEATRVKRKTGLMLLLDFEKAFDSIEWLFMIQCLRKFNFGEVFIQWVNTCYKNACSTVINNGYNCGWFKIKRGVRQGDPLSSYLFLLCIEILAQTVRDNTSTIGIVIGGHEFKINLFADDATCYIEDEDSLVCLIELIDKYSKYSGLRLNIDKSLLVYLGPWRTKHAVLQGIRVETESVNILGIQVGPDENECYNVNFINKIQAMKRKLGMWSARSLTLIGKVLIAKSMGISNLIYSLSCMECRDDTLRQAQTQVNSFIWRGKPPKVKHTAMVADYEEWGLKSPDLVSMNKSLRLAWIARLKQNIGQPSVINEQLKQYGGINLLLQCNYSYKLLKMPVFYQNLFRYFDEVRDRSMCSGVLWNNKDILINKQMLFFQEWFDKGIIYVHHLVENKSVLSMEEIQARFGVDKFNLLTYYAIKLSIQKWIRNLKNEELLDSNWKVDTESRSLKMKDRVLIAGTAKCRDYYKIYITITKETPTAMNYWTAKFIGNSEIRNSLINARLAMKETHILATQFKIIHNILAIGTHLKKWGIQQTNKCSACGETEDIVHVLWECPQTKAIYSELKNMIDKEFFSDNIQTAESIIFGTADIQANNILLIIKHTIYQLRQNKTTFNLQIFRKELTYRMLSDRRSMNENQFNMKWLNLEHVTLSLEEEL